MMTASEPVRTTLQRHASALKQRVYWCGTTFLAVCIFVFPYADSMIAWLKKPYANQLVFFTPTEAMFASIKVTLLAALVLTVPVICYHAWRFLEPALLPGEKRMVVPLLSVAWGFFALGVTFANFVIIPLALQFMLQFGLDRALIPQLGVGLYVDFNVKFLLIFGVAFELPLVLTVLARFHVITPEVLVRFRRHAVLANLILAAVLTPTSDLFNLMLMAVPLIMLYEIGIVSVRLFGRQPARSVLTAHLPEGTAGKRVL